MNPPETAEQPVIVVAGPTASGKSSLAADIAEKFNGAVVNADSMQVYRGLEVLSAAPDAAMQERAPHRLYSCLDPAVACSAGAWCDRAVAEIRRLHADGKLPVVTGGTGLYLRALMTGLARMPSIPGAVRDAIRGRMKSEGSDPLYDELASRDPDSAAMLARGDSQRICRALELLEATGRGLHAWQSGSDPGANNGFRFLRILLMPPREELYRAVEARFETMMETGAIPEVAALADRGLDPALPAMKALGVPDLIRFVRGEIDRDEATRSASQATRRYVKRQCTWFRHQFVSDILLEEQYLEKNDGIIFPKISEFVLTPRV